MLVMWLKAFPCPPPGLMYGARRQSYSNLESASLFVFLKTKTKKHTAISPLTKSNILQCNVSLEEEKEELLGNRRGGRRSRNEP